MVVSLHVSHHLFVLRLQIASLLHVLLLLLLSQLLVLVLKFNELFSVLLLMVCKLLVVSAFKLLLECFVFRAHFLHELLVSGC